MILDLLRRGAARVPDGVEGTGGGAKDRVLCIGIIAFPAKWKKRQ
jgi:hypothetical protein